MAVTCAQRWIAGELQGQFELRHAADATVAPAVIEEPANQGRLLVHAELRRLLQRKLDRVRSEPLQMSPERVD